MTKYAIHTKWSWPNGVPSPETMQAWHREHRSKTKAENIYSCGFMLAKAACYLIEQETRLLPK